MTIKKLDTVAGICEFLGITPPRAYYLARLWELTDGKEGLPCIRLGKRQLRFDRRAVELFVNPSGEQKQAVQEA